MANKTWLTGSWGTSANWSPSGLPATGDDIFIVVSGVTSRAFSSTPNFRNFEISGSGTLTITGTVALTITGSFTIAETVTITWSHTGSITWSGTNGTTNLIKTASTITSITFGNTITFNGTGVTYKLQSNFTQGSSKVFTFAAGVLNLDIYNLKCGTFVTSGSLSKTIQFTPTSNTTNTAAIIVSTPSSTTAFSIPDFTNFSYSGKPQVIFDDGGAGSGNRTIKTAASGSANYPFNFIILGDYILKYDTNSVFGDLDLTDFTGTFPTGAKVIRGSFYAGAGTIETGNAANGLVFRAYNTGTVNVIDFGSGGLSPSMTFDYGKYLVQGAGTVVWNNAIQTVYGFINIGSASSFGNPLEIEWSASLTECQRVRHTYGTLQLSGSIYLYETSTYVSSLIAFNPAYLLDGQGTTLEIYDGGLIEASVEVLDNNDDWLRNGGDFVANRNGTVLNFAVLGGTTTPNIICNKFISTVTNSSGFTYSGPDNADNRLGYQIEIRADNTNSNELTVWDMPSGVNYYGQGSVNVFFDIGSGLGDGNHRINNFADRFGFHLAHSRSVNFMDSSIGSLNLADYTGVFNLYSGGNLSMSGDFIGGAGYTLQGTATWTMKGGPGYSVFDASDNYYPVTLNFDADYLESGYIMCGSRYESTYPLQLFAGTLDVGVDAGNLGFIGGVGDIRVPSVNLDAGNDVRTFIHSAGGMTFYLTGSSGVIWSSYGDTLYVTAQDSGLLGGTNVPGCTIYLDNSQTYDQRTLRPGYWTGIGEFEENSFSVIVNVNNPNSQINILGESSLTELIYSSDSPLYFDDLTISGEFQGTAVNSSSTLRVSGYRTGISDRTDLSAYESPVIYILGHNNGPINSNVVAGDGFAADDQPYQLVVGSDITGNLTNNNTTLIFENSTQFIDGNFVVLADAPSVAVSDINLPLELTVGGNIDWGDQSDYYNIIEYFTTDETTYGKITLVSKTDSTSTFEGGSGKTFYNTDLVLDNSMNSGTFAIFDYWTDDNYINAYDPFEDRLYPGFFNISATTSTHAANLQFGKDKNFVISNITKFDNISKISSTEPDELHQLVYYNPDPEFPKFGHAGTKLDRIEINSSTYIQDSQVNLKYMFYQPGGITRDLGNNTQWVFGVLSTADRSFFYID